MQSTRLQNPFDQPRGHEQRTSDYAVAVANNAALNPTFDLLGNTNNASELVTGNRNIFYGFGGNGILAGQAQFSAFDERLYNYGVGDVRDQYPSLPKR